jgi:hypothetical protein
MPDDLDTLALRVHQIAATAAVLAEAARLPDPDGESLSHALYLLEACLLDVEGRIEALRVTGLSRAGGQRQNRDQQAERPG